jgi:hypothetical protein
MAVIGSALVMPASAITGHDASMNSEKLSMNELLALFGRAPEQSRLVGFADSEEYLAVVTYVVERSYRRY